jgi:hypothetical protein
MNGVDLRRLPPFTTLLVQTTNSLYRLVITQAPEVYVQGGVFFPKLTSAYVEGSSGGDSLKVDWIGVGLKVQFVSRGYRIITSRVRVITSQRLPSIVH